jgi:hypothetical protein
MDSSSASASASNNSERELAFKTEFRAARQVHKLLRAAGAYDKTHPFGMLSFSVVVRNKRGDAMRAGVYTTFSAALKSAEYMSKGSTVCDVMKNRVIVSFSIVVEQVQRGDSWQYCGERLGELMVRPHGASNTGPAGTIALAEDSKGDARWEFASSATVAEFLRTAREINVGDEFDDSGSGSGSESESEVVVKMFRHDHFNRVATFSDIFGQRDDMPVILADSELETATGKRKRDAPAAPTPTPTLA